MTRFLIIIIGISLFFYTACKQDKKKYDINKISSETKLYLDNNDKRGIESKSGIIYYVEKDLQTITAYEKNKIKWQTNISIVYDTAFLGKPDIWLLELKNDTLFVGYGSILSYANINVKNGKVEFMGSD